MPFWMSLSPLPFGFLLLGFTFTLGLTLNLLTSLTLQAALLFSGFLALTGAVLTPVMRKRERQAWLKLKMREEHRKFLNGHHLLDPETCQGLQLHFDAALKDSPLSPESRGVLLKMIFNPQTPSCCEWLSAQQQHPELHLPRWPETAARCVLLEVLHGHLKGKP